jgi:exo-1,4-beta-D-glucosaminidase
MDNRQDRPFESPLTSWQLQSSIQTPDAGPAISQHQYDSTSWYQAQVPTTVLAALVHNGEYRDPYIGANLTKIPSDRFEPSWWYRTEFDLVDLDSYPNVLLDFGGINYSANIWFNGIQVGNEAQVRGAYRRFQIDVSHHAGSGRNALAVEVSGPRPGDFATGFVDWNPPPPDGNMGLFRRVGLRQCAAISIEHPFVRADVEMPAMDRASLTISAELSNHTDRSQTGTLSIRIDSILVEQELHLGPRERREVTLTPASFPALVIDQPQLWWPHDLGEPVLYEMQMAFHDADQICDARELSFGIRHLEDYCNQQGHRGYRINGNEVLIRAGGWTDDLLLADSPDKLEIQMQYVKQMNLNAIRLEGIWGTDQTLYDLCDKYGILMMVGWSCHWEHEEYLGKAVDERFGGVYSPEDIDLIGRSWVDQLRWLRNHPSIFVWTVASDKVPHPELERRYIEAFKRFDPTRPYLASTGGVGSEQAIIGSEIIVSDLSGPTGVKMLGPYEYTPPVYWYEDDQRGGAYGFNTETCPGAVVPVLESLRRMLPAEHLWPPDEVWNLHCGLNAFSSLNCFCEALENRYGAVDDVERFAFRAQVLNYELARPMFEAFRVHKGRATGVVQWMLNAAWPKLYWQLYDWFLVPTAAYYGTKKACEPLQLVYDYSKHSIHLVNDTLYAANDLRAEIKVCDLNAKEQFRRELNVSTRPMSSQMLLEMPSLPNITATYFLRLRLADSVTDLASNVYWLSTTSDLLDYDAKVDPWEYYTPTKQYADFRALNSLPQVEVEVEARVRGEDENTLAVALTNQGDSMAFFVEVTAIDQNSGQSIVPVYWSDNYLTLAPGERRLISTSVNRSHEPMTVSVQGWNVVRELIHPA